MKRIINKILNSKQKNVIANPSFPSDFDHREIEIIKSIQPYTMTGPERLYSMIKAMDYVIENQIEGDIVECGVWRGGSMMVAAKILYEKKQQNKTLYLYDTYEGMTQPGINDVAFDGNHAQELFNETPQWCYATLEDVKRNMESTNYDPTKIKYIKGKVEETIPENIPQKISILRIDTDWYESTLHELNYLYPLLVPGGVLIIDDFGHWKGCRKAVEEYFSSSKFKIFLNRIDYTGRIGIKPF